MTKVSPFLRQAPTFVPTLPLRLPPVCDFGGQMRRRFKALGVRLRDSLTIEAMSGLKAAIVFRDVPRLEHGVLNFAAKLRIHRIS
jgi:hypothetical protein